MKPHLFRSVVHPGMWACMLARPTISGHRKLEPVPNVVVIYGITPRDAHFRWKKYHMTARCSEMKGGSNVGSA